MLKVNDVYIAIGSNLGNRVDNIQAALELIKSIEGVTKLVSTAFLYESSPMYYLDQQSFLNTCCCVQTTLSAEVLLKRLQKIESLLGREKTVGNGPRTIDLDILLFGPSEVFHSNADLIVPHPRMTERLFVLVPLSDIARGIIHPVLGKSIAQLLHELTVGNSSFSCTVSRVFPGKSDLTLLLLGQRSYVMGILNVTPDSFSDGGKYLEREKAIAHVREMISHGADIIDVGGQSSKPRADTISEQEELGRVVDIIQAIRNEFPQIPISIDTYRSGIAHAAVCAGASIVNDVSAGLIDPLMLSVVASLNVPYIFAHSGRVGSHPPNDFGDNVSAVFEPKCEDIPAAVATIRSQIESRISAALSAGILPWNLMLDPGFGFSKAGDLNFTLALQYDKLFAGLPFPTLCGASRKRFLRDLKNNGQSWVGSEERALLGTAAVTIAVMATGRLPDIHRVHDVGEMKHVMDIGDLMFRRLKDKESMSVILPHQAQGA